MSNESKQTNGEGKRLPLFRIILVVVVATITAIVVLQNSEAVETKLLFATVVMPRNVLLFTTFAAGLAVGVVLSFLRRRARK